MKPNLKLMQALYEFTIYREHAMPRIAELFEIIVKNFPRDLRNSAMQFLIMYATNHAIEHILMRAVEAFHLTNKALEHYKEDALDKNDIEFSDLIMIRNKLLSHKVENGIATDQHKEWLDTNYNSSEKVIKLTMKCADKIINKITFMISKDKSIIRSGSISMPRAFIKYDFDKILDALKKSNIY